MLNLPFHDNIPIYIFISSFINLFFEFDLHFIGVAEFRSAADAERVADKLDGVKFQGKEEKKKQNERRERCSE